MNKRILINFRTFLIFAVTILISIFAALISTQNSVLGWLLLVAVVLSFLILIFYYTVKCYYKFKIITFAIAIFIAIGVFLNFNITLRNWTDRNYSADTKMTVSGIVIDFYDNNNSRTLILNNVRLSDKNVSGKLKIYIADLPEGNNLIYHIKVGDSVRFTDIVYANKLQEGYKINGTTFRQNIRYTSYLEATDLLISFGAANWFENFTGKIKNTLNITLGSDYGFVAYGILTGDKNGISSETRNNFSASGLGHLLAVSGLHIGFIYMFAAFILKKLKVNRKFSFLITAAILVFYLFLANFSPSVIRAVIMAIAASLAGIFGLAKDRLSNLCLSFSVILVIFPLYLFEAGFILSFGAVFAIILFAGPIFKLLRDNRTPKFLAKPLSLLIAVQIGILPASIYFFGEIQIYSLITNLFLMPVIFVSYIAIVVSLILCLISPVFSILLQAAGIGIALIDDVAALVSHLPGAIIYYESGAIILFCYLIYFLISRFFIIKSKKAENSLNNKFIFNVVCFFSCIILSMNGLILYPDNNINNVIIPVYGSNDVTSIIVNNGSNYIVGDFSNYNQINILMRKHKIKYIDAIFLTNLTEKTAREIINFYRVFSVAVIWCPFNADYGGLRTLAKADINNFYIFEEGDKISENITPQFTSNKLLAYKFCYNDVNALFFGYKSYYTNSDTSLIDTSAIIRSYMYLDLYPDRIYLTNLSSSYSGGYPRYYVSVFENKYAMFNFENGEFLIAK